MSNGFHSRLVEVHCLKQMFLKCQWAHVVGSCVHAADSQLNVSCPHLTGAGSVDQRILLRCLRPPLHNITCPCGQDGCVQLECAGFLPSCQGPRPLENTALEQFSSYICHRKVAHDRILRTSHELSLQRFIFWLVICGEEPDANPPTTVNSSVQESKTMMKGKSTWQSVDLLQCIMGRKHTPS